MFRLVDVCISRRTRVYIHPKPPSFILRGDAAWEVFCCLFRFIVVEFLYWPSC